MVVEICAVGGWGEVGRNMTAVRVDDDVFIFDMGLHLPNYIGLTEEAEAEFSKVTEDALKAHDAIPLDQKIKDWRLKVRAIVISHAHLDHIGAVPYAASKYDAPIVCSPFSAAVLRSILVDEKISLPNDIIELRAGKSMSFGKDVSLEFVHVTHSTPQTVMAVLHTSQGAVVYGNDYKLDLHPTLGKPPNFERLKQIGDSGVLALIQDCLYADLNRKTPSEQVAKNMLTEVLLDVPSKGKGIIVSTFASHIARLKSIAELGKKLNRRVVFMGRSLAKYAFAAKDIGLIDLEKDAKIVKYSRHIRRELKNILAKKHKYLLVVSGHQGEPKSALSKMIDGIFSWKFDPEDHVIFSSHTIPAQINIKNREIMDDKLKSKGVRIFSDVHVSGHCSREDLRDIIKILRPKVLFPTHGEDNKANAFTTLAVEMGYVSGKSLRVLHNGDRSIL